MNRILDALRVPPDCIRAGATARARLDVTIPTAADAGGKTTPLLRLRYPPEPRGRQGMLVAGEDVPGRGRAVGDQRPARVVVMDGLSGVVDLRGSEAEGDGS